MDVFAQLSGWMDGGWGVPWVMDLLRLPKDPSRGGVGWTMGPLGSPADPSRGGPLDLGCPGTPDRCTRGGCFKMTFV